jgi:hypothetical protein
VLDLPLRPQGEDQGRNDEQERGIETKHEHGVLLLQSS